MKDDRRLPPPVFVVGAPRSGTTLVGNIIGNHPRIFVPRAETHYFQDVYARRKEIGDLGAEAALNDALGRVLTLYQRFNYRQAHALVARPGFRDDLVARFARTERTYGDLLDCFMRLQAEDVRWGDNTPQDVFSIADIARLFPGCHVIVCVRDVRDFLVSYKYQWRMNRPENAGRVKSLYHPVLTSLLWRANVEQVRTVERLVPREKWTLVKYEDLVHNPEREERRICAVIGEEFHPDMLLVGSNNSSFESRKPGIFTESVGRWRYGRSIRAEEIYVAELITRPQMHRLGYQPSRPAANPLRVLALFGSLPFAAFRAVYRNKGRIGKGEVRILLPYLGRKILPAIQLAPQHKAGDKSPQSIF